MGRTCGNKNRWKRNFVYMGLLTAAVSCLPGVHVRASAGGVQTEATGKEMPADGVYVPDTFSWSGGSGRLTISCEEVTVLNGETAARILFSSSHIAYVKMDETVYQPITQDEDGSLYELPLPVNDTCEIIACTTAMSTPHEVPYELYIGLDGDTKTVEEDEKSKTGDDMTHGSGQPETLAPEDDAEETGENTGVGTDDGAALIEGLDLIGTVDFSYADGVAVYQYDGGYALIDVKDDCRYLVVPEEAALPDQIPEDMKVLQQPLDHTYVAATAVMSLVRSAGALSNTSYTSMQAAECYVEEAAEAIKNGEILFAGKYSAPDYELLLAGGCDLAVESTMILHVPQVQEKLESLGIPVFVDRSSYEDHPLGRTEWIKVYGTLFDCEETADAFFDEQEAIVKTLDGSEPVGKTVAFFSVDNTGLVTVRSQTDYVAKMIEMAGGAYVPEVAGPGEESRRSSVTISMEEFYQYARDADYLIYNASIETPLSGIEELLDKNALFADFEAVKEGNVWTTDRSMYQATDTVGSMIEDLHKMLTGDKEGMMFLSVVE